MLELVCKNMKTRPYAIFEKNSTPKKYLSDILFFLSIFCFIRIHVHTTLYHRQVLLTSCSKDSSIKEMTRSGPVQTWIVCPLIWMKEKLQNYVFTHNCCFKFTENVFFRFFYNTTNFLGTKSILLKTVFNMQDNFTELTHTHTHTHTRTHTHTHTHTHTQTNTHTHIGSSIRNKIDKDAYFFHLFL